MGDLIRFPRPTEPTAVPTSPERVRIPSPEGRPQPAPLWREAAGETLREERHAQARTLAEVAEEAGISIQYLSEVERGRKEPSSEVLEAVSGALGLRLVDLTGRVTRRLAATQITGPVCLAA